VLSFITTAYPSCKDLLPAQGIIVDKYNHCNRVANGDGTASYDAIKQVLTINYYGGSICGTQQNFGVSKILIESLQLFLCSCV